MTVSIEGVDGTAESKYAWVGENVGSGEMTNTGVKENEEFAYHLRFTKPWESESDGYVRLEDGDGNTQAKISYFGE